MNLDKSKPVLLTGATGYLGGQVAKKLLLAGHRVHAPIRNPNDQKKTKYLDEIAEKSTGSIRYFQADLLENGSYDAAVESCELVIHTASPFSITVKNPQRDLIDPAVKGTENVMNSVIKTPTVKRVVLTSSCAAIYGDGRDLVDIPHRTITEEHWNETSSLKSNPYSYSKTLAEKKAWEMAGGHDRFDLVTINPAFILGPGINPNATSESFKIMKQYGDGSMKMGAPDLRIGLVDVRDVADAHYLAAYTPSAKGRHICSAVDGSFFGIADMLRPKFGNDYPLPKKKLPKWLVWLTGPMAGIPRKYVSNNVGYEWHADNSKIKKALGMEFSPIKNAVEEHFQQLIDSGSFKK